MSLIKPGYFLIPLDIYRKDLLGVSAICENEIITILLNGTDNEIEIDYVVKNKRVHDWIKPHSIVTYIKECET